MLLTLSTTYQPSADLGYLLHKHPDRIQSFALNFGQAHVFYPELTSERCTAALLLDVDPVQLVRGHDKGMGLEQYVNDRPYAASSFLCVALAQVFGTALNGNCKARPELVNTPIPLQAHLASVPCASGEAMLKNLFEPLGYTVTLQSRPLDEHYTEWGPSPYYNLTLEATCLLSELLSHIYVLIPVLDNNKHYWIGDDEVEKLLKHGHGWLEKHPYRDLIARRYLRHRDTLVRSALARLLPEEAALEEKELATLEEQENKEAELSPHEERLAAVMEVLKQSGAKSVLDLGCGEGKFLALLLKEKTFERVLGLDVSYRVLEQAKRRLHLDHLPPKQRERITLMHGALTYRDRRLEGYDAAAIIEVIEHLDEARLAAFERVVFEFAQPTSIIITTPNAEYNVKFPTLAAGHFRHQDHRFEWTRQQFQDWSKRVAEEYGYIVQFRAIGSADTEVGALSQMAVFSFAHAPEKG
jgi:3' terminal RNA ribose 2'-O-methyltransferase Hen1